MSKIINFFFLLLLTSLFFTNGKDINENDIISNGIRFSKESGFYESNFELALSSQDKSTIFYTIDGSDPVTSKTATEYKNPILIKDRTEEPNIYSEYEEDENSPISITRQLEYKKPPHQVDKATVIRAVTKNSEGYGTVVNKIYFITDDVLSQYEKLTVISLITNPDNLFGPEKGIYVTGNQFIEWKKSSDYNPNKSAWDRDNICNYFMKGSDWEREAQLIIFEEGSLSLEQNVGIRIKGSSTRNAPQKNFNIYARKKYGPSLFNSSTLFPNNNDLEGKKIEKNKSFAIRSIFVENRLNDKFVQTLIKGRKSLLNINMKSAVLFLNGEYWGLYTILESTSAETFSAHYNLQQDDIIIFKNGELEDGTDEDLSEYIHFIDSNSKKDLSNKNNYLEVANNLDIDSIIEHYALGIYLGTYDWPNYNYGIWRYKGEKIEGNPYSDGKWRFFSYDFDYTMGNTYKDFEGVEGYEYDNFKHMMKGSHRPTSLFLALLKNEEFRNKFINVFCDYVNEIANYEKMNKLLDEYKNIYTDLLSHSKTRWWGFYGGNKMEVFAWNRNQYNEVIEELKVFAKERSHYALGHLKRFFNLTSDLQELTIMKEGNGNIQINSIIPEIKNGIWKGKYFCNIPINISAIPSEKEKFDGWTGDIESKEKSITIDLINIREIKAIFRN